jgi:hypothetical protein
MTVSEDDRNRVIAALREHVGSGALEMDEYGTRLSEAYQAASVEDLQRALRGLPGADAVVRPAPAAAPPRPTMPSAPRMPHVPVPHAPLNPAKVEAAARAAWGAHLGAYLSVNLMLVVIWFLAGMGYFWPIWPMMGWGIGLAAHGMAHSAAMRHRRQLNRG